MPARKSVAQLLEKKAKVTDHDAHWEGTYDGMLEYWYDTSAETTAYALRLLVKEDRASGLLPKAARWLAEHRDGDYWFTTKQTAMVIEGLTDYLMVSGELANESDVEVLVNGASVGKRHFAAADAFGLPWKITVPAAQAGSGGTGDHPQDPATGSRTGRRRARGTRRTSGSTSKASSR